MENCSELESFICKMSTSASFTNLDYRITKDEIKMCISKLKPGKAVGIDRLSAEMIKASVGQLLSVYEQLFNYIFRKGVYPHNWKKSFIVPLFKSGSCKDPSNYRGIAINSTLGKVFSMILTSRLESFAKDNQLIDNTQIGFKKGCRTTDHMFILTTLIDKYVKKLKTPLYVCFVDFKKAYDCVWRQALLYKLLMVNINGLFFNILKSMYSNNEICIRVSSSQRSRFFTSNVGVRQGDSISPILFNLYVSDLQSYLGFDTDAPLLDTSYVNCLMYADDLVLVSRSEEGLQGLIDKLGDYCKRWRMDVNTQKTKTIKFSGNGHKCKTNFFYREKQIENVINYKYLGLVFNAGGAWSYSVDNLSTRGIKALFSLKRYICTGNIKPRLGLKLFDQMIKPILCYASEIWTACDLSKRKVRTGDGLVKYLDNIAIERVHVQFCKFILGVNRRAVNLAVKGELGRFPVAFSCVIQAFRYWYHLMESSNPLLQEAFSVSKSLHYNGVSTWFSFYDNLCKLVNVGSDNPPVVFILQSFLCEKFRIYWFNTVKSFSRLDAYLSFKSKFCMECYLDTISNRTHRVWYTKVRISNHRFAVETGRFSKTPREERLCTFCKAKQKPSVEDEMHVLIHCPRYAFLRKDLYDCIYHLCPNFKDLHDDHKFNYLLNSDGPIVKVLARFFYLASLEHSSVKDS